MNKKVNIGKLKLEKLTIAKLTNPGVIKGGTGTEVSVDTTTNENSNDVEGSKCMCSATEIGNTQTINQGPTKNLILV